MGTKHCPHCRSAVAEDALLCSSCGKSVLGESSFSCGVSIFGILLIALALVHIGTVPFKKSREQGREKACYANMRIILGAVTL